MTPVKLKRAPIVEALIDIQVTPHAESALPALEALLNDVGSDFTPATPIHFVQQQIDLSPASTPTLPTRNVLGYIARSNDQRRVAQGRLNGVSLSILAPYGDWQELVAETRAFWTRYLSAMQPGLVVRVATRFINRIALPPHVASLTDWFKTYPELGAEVAPAMAEFLMRLVVPMAKATGIVTLATEQATVNSIHVILDLDVFRFRELTPSGEFLWEAVEELHEEKNRLFFGSITERTAKELCV